MTTRNTGDWIDYEERLGRVTAYIYDHLDEELDLNQIAEIACLSPYHWHRVYHAIVGETLAATVKRLRLHRAAGYLAHTSLSIEDVAERSGYPNLQSFTRIFSAAFGLPPAQYRRSGSHTRFQLPIQEKSSVMYDVRIQTLPLITALAVAHTGSYMQIGKAFDTLYTWLGTRNLLRPDMRSIGIYLDDPTVVAEEKLRSRAGVTAAGCIPIEAPLEYTQIAAGPYAVLQHKGPYADMRAAYRWLYGQWLPQSGRDAADAPIFEEYLNSPRDTAPTELITDIYLPLRQD